MTDDLKRALSHVLWMGGSPCSGKSSIAEIISKRHDLQYYRCDDRFFTHQQLVNPVEHPAFHSLLGMSWNDIWMRPVETLIAHEFFVYEEEFGMIVADLQALPDDRPIVAEGAALIPSCVVPVLARPRQAVWVVPTRAFQLEHYRRRTWISDILGQCADPKQAFHNWMMRDAGFGQAVTEQAQAAGLRVLIVDGRRSIAQNAALIEAHFGLNSDAY